MTRKELVKMLEEKYGTKAKYLGAPSLAYEITIRGAALTIDREGKVFNAAGMEVCAEELLNEEVNANVLELKLNLKPEKQNAALILFTLMYKTAQERRYVTFRPKTTTNEKYTFRTWLLSLGMKGEGYKAARKELLKELAGNSAFKNPKKEVENDE